MKNQTRRTALKALGTTCAAIALPANLLADNPTLTKPIRLGVIADLHGGLAVDAESRLDTFLNSMADKNVDALIQMGDFAYPNKKHQRFGDKFNAAHDNTIHVIGNHEFDFGLGREDCFEAWGIESAYYRRDIGGLRILVLDGNEKNSPTYTGGYHSYIGEQQQAWLSQQLDQTDRPVLILSHQPLAGRSAINNATEIQQLLAKHKSKIVLCINGHAHVDSLLQVDGVTYLHINSASYYWVGGKKRMSYYQDPLYTTLTIDPTKSVVWVEGKSSQWKQGDSPATVSFFERENAPPETIVVPAIRERKIDPSTKDRGVETWPTGLNNLDSKKSFTNLKVMTWNIWGRLNQDPRYTVNDKTARERAIEIIKASGADVIAMIETYGSASEIAESLGFFHYTSAADANLCIFSRYPLTDIEPLKGLSSFSFIAATATLPSGQKIRIYDIWLTSGGRHIVEIKDKNISDQDFCNGDDIRFEMLKKFLDHEDFKKHLANSAEVPIIVAGDFNCVSHLDYTAATRDSKLNQSRILPIKASKAMHKRGFTDTFRDGNPDILDATLGYTWTTVGLGYTYISDKGFVPVKENPEPEYRDPYTRIDFIYSTGSRLKTNNSKVISHHSSQAKRSFPEFPSDHAAVLTEFDLDDR